MSNYVPGEVIIEAYDRYEVLKASFEPMGAIFIGVSVRLKIMHKIPLFNTRYEIYDQIIDMIPPPTPKEINFNIKFEGVK